MDTIKAILIRVILMPIAGLLCSQTALVIAHENNWYPERQLAGWVMTAPSLLQIEWVKWGLLTFAAILLWVAADYLIYRRNARGLKRKTKSTVEAAADKTSATPRSKLEWNFEVHGPLIGMSAGTEQQVLVHDFQARGWNRTGDPILRVQGYVRSDRTNREYPTELNLLGKRVSLNEINPIPIDAVIDTFTPFSPDRKPISMRTFLTEIVPFTFFFEYDGTKYRRSFTLEQIEPRITQYEQTIRRSSIAHPEISQRKQPEAASDGDKVAAETSASDAKNAIIGVESLRDTKEDFEYLATKSQVQHNIYKDGNRVAIGPAQQRFVLRFSLASKDSVHMYKDGLSYLARIRGRSTGDRLKIGDYPSAASSFVISVGEHFLAMNNLGQMVQGKIVSVKHDGHGNDYNEVTFDYLIAPARGGEFLAI